MGAYRIFRHVGFNQRECTTRRRLDRGESRRWFFSMHTLVCLSAKEVIWDWGVSQGLGYGLDRRRGWHHGNKTESRTGEHLTMDKVGNYDR